MARYPWWANFLVASLYHSSQPGRWWNRTIAGYGPGPSGLA